MSNSSILSIQPVRVPWATLDPFIFCAYHFDNYPGGNEDLGPNASLEGRSMGQDFAGKDGWNMYHGQKVPGFPGHPHKGFETITIVNTGMVDHSDSIGGEGRFGDGDVQWLTSGKGVQHAEMFPLLNKEANPFELFQLWINLPRKSKNVDPHYKMLWAEDIPNITATDDNGKSTSLNLIAGTYGDHVALSPTPDSWAADPENEVQIWTLKLEAGATFTLPASKNEVNRALYFYEGGGLSIAGSEIPLSNRVVLKSNEEVEIKNGDTPSALLFLQGRPISEPVVQYGPFVMNTEEEIREAYQEYRQTQFGGWPYPDMAPTHPKSKGRYAKFSDGSEVIK